MSWQRFVVRRILLTIPLLLGIVFITFMLIRLGGQDAVGMLTGPFASEAEIAQIKANFGLDKPLLEQFWVYLLNLLQGDLGKSWQSNTPVLDEILLRLPASFEILFLAMALGAAVGVPVGVHAAMHPNRLFDQVSRVLSLVAFSIPTYWLALMAVFFFFFLLGWAPAPMGRLDLAIFPPPTITGSYLVDGILAGDFATVKSALSHLVMPVIVFALIVAAPIIKQTRAIGLDVIGGDYVRYARASGYSPRTIRRIIRRNSFTPVLTYVGSELATLLAAVSLVEFIFSWGGLGQWGLNAILFGDFAAVQGFVLVLATFAALVFLIVDLLVLILEPRAMLR